MKNLFLLLCGILLLASCQDKESVPTELSESYVETNLYLEIREQTEFSNNDPDNELMGQHFGGALINDNIIPGSSYEVEGILEYKTEIALGIYENRVQTIKATIPASKLVPFGQVVQDSDMTLFLELFTNKVALDPVTGQVVYARWKQLTVTAMP